MIGKAGKSSAFGSREQVPHACRASGKGGGEGAVVCGGLTGPLGRPGGERGRRDKQTVFETFELEKKEINLIQCVYMYNLTVYLIFCQKKLGIPRNTQAPL